MAGFDDEDVFADLGAIIDIHPLPQPELFVHHQHIWVGDDILHHEWNADEPELYPSRWTPSYNPHLINLSRLPVVPVGLQPALGQVYKLGRKPRLFKTDLRNHVKVTGPYINFLLSKVGDTDLQFHVHTLNGIYLIPGVIDVTRENNKELRLYKNRSEPILHMAQFNANLPVGFWFSVSNVNQDREVHIYMEQILNHYDL